MQLQSLVCPHCGAMLNITNSTKVVHCEFCDADIMIEQSPNQQAVPPMYGSPEQNQAIPPRFSVQNEMPPQQYGNSNVNIQPFQNYPPGMLFDDAAFRRWKKKFWRWHRILAVVTIAFVLMMMQDSHSDPALIPFFAGIGIFMIAPPVLAGKKPSEPDASRNRTGWNVFKYYLMFAGNIIISFFVAGIIAMILGIG